ncbi:hypothetical protein NFI96_000348 [Prochilodus magdalenae]|nr:hypothetical protein NFI96_000348 [Prochilodus magdalenae]
MRWRDHATHSLEYIFTGVTPGISIPEFTAVAQVDGNECGCYDSEDQEVTLKAEWLKDSKDVEHWNFMKKEAHRHQTIFKSWIPSLMKRFNQTEERGYNTLGQESRAGDQRATVRICQDFSSAQFFDLLFYSSLVGSLFDLPSGY